MRRSLTIFQVKGPYPDLTVVGWSYEERLRGSKKSLLKSKESVCGEYDNA